LLILDESSLQEILGHDELGVENEVEVFSAALL